ncbi:hypothetical protein NKR19_g1790 [Coniochaeta hoffmannii]|uniref:DUF8021 domain-containing protein n=1 Tax=Coniochaeta hoffmannii TaxID=91930 RepID=A0AA38W2Y7_9PEZI|nr:hypothetical protein NKR19_g1790 [Coniochaeta hoffmannii]
MSPPTTALLWGLAPAAVLARCQWSHIQDATDAYLESQTSGKPYAMFLSDKLVYRENNRIISPRAGIINKPLAIAHQHRLIDQDGCASYIEQIVTDPKNPYVIGTQLRFNESSGGGPGLTVASVDSIVTTTGDWLFNASKTLSYVVKEDWGTMDQDARPDRGTLRAVANLYLDLWGNEKSRVPWGSPCDRLEGSAYTGNGSASDSCAVGIPTGPQPPVTDRRYVYDETVGAVSVLCTMGAMGDAPDSHEFRVEGERLRYVHTMTVLRNQTANQTTNQTATPRLRRVRRSINLHG